LACHVAENIKENIDVSTFLWGFLEGQVIFEGSQSITALQAFYKLSGFDSRLLKNGVMSCSL
jgi:hypothetical protein